MALAPAVTKALDRLAAATGAGAPYEGQQVIKTVAARLRARGARADAADLTERGAAAQLAAGQVCVGDGRGWWWREEGEEAPTFFSFLPLIRSPFPPYPQITCGSELASALLDTYTADGVRADEPPSADGGPPLPLARVLRLLDAFATSRADTEAARFAASAVKWARDSGADTDTLARLHLACAAALDAAAGGGAKGLAAAAPHWARSRSPASFAAAVADASSSVPVSERGAWVARAALQTAGAGDGASSADAVADAAALLQAAAAGPNPPGENDPYTSFAKLFISALQRGSPALAATVAREFGPALERSGDLPPLAERACGAVFGGGGGGGGLSDVMMRVLAGGA